MKIKFGQAGGITGLHLGCELETLALPGKEAAEIENLVKTCGVLKPKYGFFKPIGCDLLYYRISVESDEINYDASFNDLTIPEGARPLLGRLRKHARRLGP